MQPKLPKIQMASVSATVAQNHSTNYPWLKCFSKQLSSSEESFLLTFWVINHLVTPDWSLYGQKTSLCSASGTLSDGEKIQYNESKYDLMETCAWEIFSFHKCSTKLSLRGRFLIFVVTIIILNGSSPRIIQYAFFCFHN